MPSGMPDSKGSIKVNNMTEKEFQNIWRDKLKENLKDFPNDFITDEETTDILLPPKPLIIANELFGNYEISDLDDNVVYTTDNYSKVKYILYANRARPSSIKIPIDLNNIEKLLKLYEKTVDTFLKVMNDEFKKEFPNSKSFPSVSNSILTSLNLKRL